jgi:hypothetical protein
MEKTKVTPCPSCGYTIDAHISPGEPEAKPSPHDVSICAMCVTWNKYDENLDLVPFTQEDRENSDSELLAQMDMIEKTLKDSKLNLN